MKVEILALKLIHIKMQVNDDTILNLSLMLETEFYFPK